MPLVETLVLTLGPAVAKAILKGWLQSGVAEAAGASLIDLLKSRTKDVLAQQRGRRQFEAIGEQVAQSLQPLFEVSSLDDQGCTAVALAIAGTLEQAQIDPRLLAQHDLDPSQLAEHLLSVRPDATRDFSLDETSLYRRILTESASYIVDIASKLPGFSERTLSEVLKREDQLISITKEILAEVHRIRRESQQANPHGAAARFEEEYRRAVIRRLDRLELFGADVSAISKRQRLSVAYVNLSVSRSEQTRKHQDLDERDEDIEVTLPADEALAGSSRLIVRGKAGSGKTTLLKWIAVHSAARSFQDNLATWNSSIPFFIRLRQCVDSGLPAPEDFPRLVAPFVAGEMSEGWVHEQLRSGRAIVLIDGVDEVPQLQRAEVREWIAGLVGTFGKSRFLVSSRSHAIDEGWMTGEQFDDALLQEMDLRQIDAFVEHWHRAVQEDLLDPEEAAEMDELAAHLQGELRGKRSLRNLATNPLLCALICALHRDRRQQLPADRIELYEAGVYMLLERRDVEKRVDQGDYPELSYRVKRDLLEDLAYWMLQNGYSEVAQEQVDLRLERALSYVVGLKKGVTADDVRRLFVERSGLLDEPLAGRFGFAHRTFQEFLAAQAALDEGDIGVLINHAHDYQWRQVILAAAGLGSKRVRNKLLSGLLERGDAESVNRHAIHLLAVACLETATGLDPEVRDEVRARLEGLVPPKNLIEAATLASGRELAVPFLRYDPTVGASVTEACVYSLSAIGSEEALIMLEGYADDAREAVQQKLLSAWDSFDREEYGRRIVSTSGLSTQYLVDVYRPEVLQYLSSERLASCTSLSLTGSRLQRSGQVSDLSPLASLGNLSSLELSGLAEVSDLSPLAGLTNLSSLVLAYLDQVSDLSSLTGLANLTSLALHNLGWVSDLSPLAGLANLTSLELHNLGSVSDLSPLAGLANLTSLELSMLYQVSDLTPLTSLVNLTSLELSVLYQVSDLTPLTSLVNLSSLELSGLDSVSDLSPLVSLASSLKIDLPRGMYRRVYIPPSLRSCCTVW